MNSTPQNYSIIEHYLLEVGIDERLTLEYKYYFPIINI